MAKAKRWKVSDIVAASLGEGAAASVVAEASWMRGSDVSDDSVLAELFERFPVTMSRTCGVNESAWWRMTHEQRCNALVATARRLNVPMNG